VSTPLVGTVAYHPASEARDPRGLAAALALGQFSTSLADMPEDLAADLVGWCARFEAWATRTRDWQPSSHWEVSDQR
jgi:hypothetical protein